MPTKHSRHPHIDTPNQHQTALFAQLVRFQAPRSTYILNSLTLDHISPSRLPSTLHQRRTKQHPPAPSRETPIITHKHQRDGLIPVRPQYTPLVSRKIPEAATDDANKREPPPPELPGGARLILLLLRGGAVGPKSMSAGAILSDFPGGP